MKLIRKGNIEVEPIGEHIFRMKGGIGIKGEETRFISQSVHMVFTSQPGRPWGDEAPNNRIVFIGRDLPEDYIRESLHFCLA